MIRHAALRLTFYISLVCMFSINCGASDLSRPEAKRIIDKVVAGINVTEISVSTEQMQRLKNIHDAPTVLSKVFVLQSAPPQSTNALMGLAQSLSGPSAASFRDGGRMCLPDSSDQRIMMGQFVLCVNMLTPDITWQNPGIKLTLKTPLKLTLLEITGIAENSPTEKVVEDTWQYDFSSWPTEMKDAIKPAIYNGKAQFHLYDDGWRFEKFLQ
jgi:hypothetical protein